jgi:hypothetical protein
MAQEPLTYSNETSPRHQGVALNLDAAEDGAGPTTGIHAKGRLTLRMLLQSRRFLQVSLAEIGEYCMSSHTDCSQSRLCLRISGSHCTQIHFTRSLIQC